MIKKQTIEYKIVSLIGLAGEMQTEELYKLKYGKEYIRKTISKLITNKYVKVYKFNNKKYLRLTVACKRYLSESHSDRGIASKCKESKECIGNAIKELETAGYIKRTMMHGEDGKILRMEYEIFEEPYAVAEAYEHNSEKPCEDKPYTEEPSEEKPLPNKPSTENPSMDFQWKEKPSEGNYRVNNTKINKKENNNILYNNTQSNPISSKPQRHSVAFEMSIYRKTIKDNIDYDILAENDPIHKDMIDEIVELMAETLSSQRAEITIASNTHSMDDVTKRFMDINSEHIKYIIECVSSNTTRIANIKQYMLATIFNAPITIDSYYTTRVNHDLYG